ncbi:hypothetical protein PV327_011059, partial [Microctonus hyperodae]
MTSRRQCAVVWWFETNQVSTTLLDVLPYQHREIGAVTMISGHKAKVVAICNENDSKDAVISMNCMLNNVNSSTMAKTSMKKPKKGSTNTVKKNNSKKAVIEMQIKNKHECQSGIGEMMPMFHKETRNEKQFSNNATSFFTNTTSSYNALPSSKSFSVQSLIKPPLIVSTAANESSHHFKFHQVPLSSGTVKTSSSNITFHNTLQDSSSLSSVTWSPNTNLHNISDHQSPHDYVSSWDSSLFNKKVTPITPNSILYSPPSNSVHSPSTLTDLDSWRQNCSNTIYFNTPPNSQDNERKILLNIPSNSPISKCVPSVNPSTSSCLTLNNTGTDNSNENCDEEFIQKNDQKNLNSPPASPTVFSLQQIDNNQKYSIGMICNTLGVTREKVQFLQSICNLFRQYLDDEKENDVQQSVGNIVVIAPEYYEAGENKVEIFPGGGFYMNSNIWNLICLTHGPEFSNWKSFVRDVLLQIYENKLINYTAKGKRGGPCIDAKLLKSLF